MGTPLNFSLGLATTGFLSPLGGARAALAGFIGLATGGAGVIAGMFNEINRGGNLQDLSNRTGETVGNLFKLQEAFDQSGVSAGNVGTILLKFQKSLSGVGEMGENTAEAFQALGLSVEQLRGLSSPEALLRVFESLNKLDRNSATGVSNTLFGRGAGGDILQLARDTKDFAKALEDSERQAQLFQRHAAAFDRLGDSFKDIKREVRGLLAGLAADITPALQGILDSIIKRDFQTLGNILELSLTLAFEKSVNTFFNAMVRAFAALPALAKASFDLGIATLGTGMAGPIAQLLADGFARDKTAFGEDQAEMWAIAAEQMGDVRVDALKEAALNFRQAFEDAKNVPWENLFGEQTGERLRNLLTAVGAFTAPGAVAGPGGGVGGTNLLSSTKGSAGGEANALERIGFGAGASSQLTNYTRQTAANTAQIVRGQINLINGQKMLIDKFGFGYPIPNV